MEKKAYTDIKDTCVNLKMNQSFTLIKNGAFDYSPYTWALRGLDREFSSHATKRLKERMINNNIGYAPSRTSKA